MKEVFIRVALLALAVVAFLEAFTSLDILDQDKTVFCEEIVIDTVTNVVEVPGRNITRVVEYETIDTIVMSLYKVDTIENITVKHVRDTILEYVKAGAEFRVDTLEFPNARLEYGILTKGELIGFYPSLTVRCPSVELNRWSVGGGVGGGVGGATDGALMGLGSVKYRFNSRWDGQLIGGLGENNFIGFISNYSF